MPKVAKVPMPRMGRIIMVDPQVILWKRKMRKFRRIKKEAVELIESLPEEKRLEFWSTPHRRLKNTPPIEALKEISLCKIALIKEIALVFVRAYARSIKI